MNQKQRMAATAGAFLVVGGALGAYAWFGVKVKSDEEAKQKAFATELFGIKRADVTRIVLTKDSNRIAIERGDSGKDEGEGWKLVEPMAAAADPGLVKTLLERIDELRSKTKVRDDGGELATYGLEAPTLKVEVKGKGDKSVELLLGKRNSFDDSLYVKRASDGEVHLADGSIRYSVDKSAFDYRDKKVLTFEDRKVKRIALDVPKGKVVLEPQEKGDGWKLVEPVAESAERSNVNTLLADLRNMKATAFPEENPTDLKKYGLDKPKAKVTLSIGDDKAQPTQLTLLVGQTADNKTYAWRGEGPVAEVDRMTVGKLDRGLLEFQDKTVLPSFSRTAVSRVEVSSPAGKWSAKKRPAPPPQDGEEAEEMWDLETEGKPLAKKWKISSLISNLEFLKARKFADENPKDLKKYGVGPDAKQVAFFDDKGTELARLFLGTPAADDFVHVKSAHKPRVCLVQGNSVKDIPWSMADVKDTGEEKSDKPGEAPAPVVGGGGGAN